MSARAVVSLSGPAWTMGEGPEPSAWVPARVPGNVQSDLWRAGLKPDPYFGTNAEAFRDTESKTWVYERVFDAPRVSRSLWLLQAQGLDYRADVLLNGRPLGGHEGAWGEAVFPVTGGLRRTGNRLRVIIHPLELAPRESRAAIDPLAPLRHDGRWMVKPGMGFSWDFAPRLVPTGIWKDVVLLGTGGVRLHGQRTDTTFSAGNAEARLSFTACAWSDRPRAVEAILELYEPGVDRPALALRAPARLLAGDNEIGLAGTLARPRPWWPLGAGEPFLYRAVLRVQERGATLDEIEWSVGVRTIRMVRTPRDAAETIRIPAPSLKDETMLVVNGRPIAYRGVNFAPIDVLPGCADDARSEGILRLAADASVNFMRLWGGGHLGRESFFDAADRLGIMLWQEFPLGCMDHEGSDHYREVLAGEVRSVVRALRGHPCLAAWSAGNELYQPHSGMGPQDRTLRLIQAACTMLDPERIYLPTTPYPGVFHGPYTFDLFGQGEFGGSVDHVQFCNTAPAGAYNECGVSGPALPSTVRAWAPAEEVWPARRGSAWEFHKAFGAWGGGETWLLPQLIERYFGSCARLEDLFRGGQFLQAIGMQYLLEELRRRWPDVPGTMPWCFNTPWTSFAGSFVVAWPARPLPSYHALSRAYAARAVTARLQSFVAMPGSELAVEAHVINDGGAPTAPGTVTLTAGPAGAGAQGQWLRRTFDAPGPGPMGRAAAGTARFTVPADFHGVAQVDLEWTTGAEALRNRYWIGIAPGASAADPKACFAPLLARWESDPSSRLPSME